MSNSASVVTFIILSFSLGLILIMKKDTLPPGTKRPLAIIALVMISFSFFMMVYSFFSLPQQ
ncbi:hypothetical protein [Paenibacillus mucilaginosus]|uniref:Signal transduction histidine kinase n=3 Tax=Paenibacillus mucilaginosus TaxID=61624 RepID=H6NJ29_9BACL|nr:hypothetical protein [Paenibacillus mucilaginosus]AEI40143.1 hypothetical protein KNP414_01579 [Paenibacillus mucilaginosus KNP414]AFC28791.1 hypothetical protein PM3016_1887 [Paenibacillus mucilaginosus 3016]AFH60967.1 hypothetical protein B2K_09575 [Paenibacillus mucilaginosus K02]MCG7215746.1 hypothetical protein [Paenibacillus mucilaginosus]WDM29377.1 hypothetical protein KCX80_09540 [Paenibacillus mucilaginosus]